MKVKIGIIGMGMLIALQACNTDYVPTRKKPIKTMHLSANGSISVEPDEAHITVYLESKNLNLKKSKQCLLDKSELLNQSIRDFGIEEKDIMTTSVSQTKEYRWHRNSQVFKGYQCSMSTTLYIRDMKIMDDLYTSLLMNENIRIGYMTFGHSKLDSLENAAYRLAIDNANELADQLLSRMGESEKEILKIGNVSLPTTQGYYDYDKNAEYENAAIMSDPVGKSKQSISINSGTVYV